MAAQAKPSEVALRGLWDVLSPFRRRVGLVIAFTLFDTLLTGVGIGAVFPFLESLLDPQHQSSLISRFLPALNNVSGDIRLLALATGTLALFALKAVVSWITVASTHKLLQEIRFHWVEEIGTYYLRGSFLEVASRKQGELLNDWFNETISATRFLQSYLAYVSSMVLVGALIALGLAVEWRVTVGLMVIGALAALVFRRWLYVQSSSLSARKLELNQGLSAAMVEDLASIREIKLMGAESARLDSLRSRSRLLGEVFERSTRIAEVPRISSEFATVGLLMTAIVIATLIFGLATETMLPMLVFFSVAFHRLSSAASVMTGARIKWLNEIHSLERVRALSAKARHRENLLEGRELGSINTDLIIRGVSHSFGDVPVLIDVEATIPKGKLTLLVGPSGAGKSTLLDLILRLVEPQQGTIEANGLPSSTFRLKDWRRAFGYVTQDVSLFNGTIRMNLLLARPGATDDELREVCRLARADEFISALPDNYDAQVGERGHILSGGQRKRIGIARALLGGPSVLILDEATTSFEQSLEHDILRGIRAAAPSLTIVQVTHRLESVRDVDWMIVLDRGRVVSTGAPPSIAAAAASRTRHDGFEDGD